MSCSTGSRAINGEPQRDRFPRGAAGPLRLAIVGAGPIGLEAALYARQRGFHVQVFEKGRIGENLRRWGHVRLFTPFAMNASEWGKAALKRASGDFELPCDDSLLTGREYVAGYLEPLSRLPLLAGCIFEETSVRAIGRWSLGKNQGIGSPHRGHEPFRLLVESERGQQTVEADLVFDCTGTFPHHNHLGAGGIPCPGEQSLQAHIDYGLPNVACERDRYAGRTTLVLGNGYSAATTVVALAELHRSDPQTRVIWATRRDAEWPIAPVPDDPLPERARLTQAANELATSPTGAVHWIPGVQVERLELQGSAVEVTLGAASAGGGMAVTAEPVRRPPRIVRVDRIVANVGYRPDRSLYEELQVHECYATQGPIRLAAHLLGEASSDCLATPAAGEALLRNPEPGFYILGAKSYGRDSRFLLRTGLEQIPSVVDRFVSSEAPAVAAEEAS